MNIRKKIGTFFQPKKAETIEEEKALPFQFDLFFDNTDFSHKAKRISDNHLGAFDEEGIKILNTITYQMSHIQCFDICALAPYSENRYLCLSTTELTMRNATQDAESKPESIFTWPRDYKFDRCMAIA